MNIKTGYLAAQGYLPELLKELEPQSKIEHIYEDLVLTSAGPIESKWAKNTWLNPQIIPIQSISQAANALRAIQRNWALYSVSSHRRGKLISEKLPKISLKSFEFPGPLPQAPLGSWSLIENDLLIASPHCSSPFVNGEIHFNENKAHPPSRAYLKLWEALTLAQEQPTQGSRCLDMGSSPGGWTWALHELGASVISVDKAPLTPEVAGLPRVQSLARDAFTLDPQEIGPINWFFSDVICYPRKLYDLVNKWMRSGNCQKFICTLKFQGKELSLEDREAIEAFSKVPGSTLRHLFHNKHELTWTRL